MRILTSAVVTTLLFFSCPMPTAAQTLTWDRSHSPNTSRLITKILEQDTETGIERIVAGVPIDRRSQTRREMLYDLVSLSFDSSAWSQTATLVSIVKLAQASSLLTATPARLSSFTKAEIGEARRLRDFIGYPSLL